MMDKKISKTFIKETVIILIFLGVQSISIYAQEHNTNIIQIHRIHLTCKGPFGKHKVKNWLNIVSGSKLSMNEIHKRCEEVLHRLQQQGYYFARFEEVRLAYRPDSSMADLILTLNEGKRLKIHSLTMRGVDQDSLQDFPQLQSKPGKPFNSWVLQSDIARLLDYFDEQGYPFSQIKVARLDFARREDSMPESLDLVLQIKPGPRVRIGEIEITGNEETRDYVILRELGIRPGELYVQRKIEKIQSRLMRLGYFRQVQPPRLELLPDGTGRLIVQVEEGHNNRVDGVVGYNPGVGRQKGFVTGLLDLSFGNLMGTGRQIDAHWERRSEKTQQLRFRYLEPWIAGLPLHAGISFEQLIRDTSYVQRDFGLNLHWMVNENLSFTTRIARNQVTPDSLGALLLGIPPSRTLNLGFGVSFNTLNDLLNPRKGLKYEATFELGKKKIDSPDQENETVNNPSFEQKRWTVDFEAYWPLFRWQVFAVGIHGRQITSDEEVISITDQYRFGGTLTLRGYREEQFRGSRIAWSNIEYRYLLGPRSRFFVFLDVGYFFREDLINGIKKKIEDAKIGYGLGLRVDTPLGLFGIDYGLGEGDGLSNGKVHVRLINSF